MKLKVSDRVMVLGLLPEQGDFSTLKAIHEARLNVSLTESEVEEFEFRTEREGDKASLKWNPKGEEEREIDLNKTSVKLIKEKLEELNEKKELTSNHLSIYEKFVGGE